MMRPFIRGMLFAASFVAAGGLLGTVVAQIVPALPFQLQNNTVADATQVMANFNQILNNTNANAAKNGANSDITSLLGLTTPISPSQGGTTTYTGGTSTGTANAQVVASVVPTTFTLAVGTRVVFVATTGNTAAMTLNVASSGVKNVNRQTTNGMTGTVGGEITGGGVTELVYDGTAWQIVGGPAYVVGEIKDYPGTGAPPGWALLDGSCQSQATYGALFNILSTTWGTCGGGLFALPDYRGRVSAGKDNMGGSAANRITNAGSGCVGTTLAVGCGSQNQTIAQGNLPNVNFTLSISDTRTWATAGTVINTAAVLLFSTPVGGATWGPGSVAVNSSGGSISGTAASGGSGTALTTLQPSIIVNKIIKL